MIDLGRHNVMGVLVNAVDYEAAVTCIVTAAFGRQKLAVSAVAVHGIMTGVLDAQQKYRLNCLDMVVPDGQPVRWALRWLHEIPLPDRVYGPRLMLAICGEAARLGLPIFLYGSTDEILAMLCNRLRQTFPSLSIVGAQSSKFRCLSAVEKDQLVREIQSSGARIVLVGLGCPRQEVWAYEFRSELSMPLVAVGAAFSFLAGTSPQAPEWMQARGFEWLFRLASEPTRLWRRYLFLNPLFLGSLLVQLAGLRFDSSGRKPRRDLLYG
jgi:N-acetylglucosaminyldiphosphoundecaprenol N-acetyl-beta-D-mannosaminyltransferase